MTDGRESFSGLSERMRAIRLELFGPDGLRVAGQSSRRFRKQHWQMEINGPIAGHFILGFIEVTGANPSWLLRGAGERYQEMRPRGHEERR